MQSSAVQGIVMRSTGSWYEVRNFDEVTYKCRLRGKFKIKGMKVTNPITVGDKVAYIIENEEEKIGIITDILPRENYIIRKSVHKTAHGHLIAANIDQAILIVTLAFPRTSLGFIDRFLVSAEAFRIPASLVFNKQDLLDEDAKNYLNYLRQVYDELGYTSIVTSALEGEGIEDFRALLKDKKSLLSGHSGVGKSTLVNCIAPHLNLRTSEVSTFANKGVHTTTFSEMFEIEPEMYIIDTPGIKELGLMDIKKEELSHFFPEMRALLGKCKYHNCLHVHEPKCAVIEAVKEERISFDRYNSYLSMIEDYDNRR